MGETDFKKMFARNLTYYINSSEKTQADVARDLHLSKATLSSWCIGTRTPRMDKVDLLCDYFGIRRSDLMEEHNPSNTKSSPEAPYLTTEETAVVTAYRKADDTRKDIVCDVLRVKRDAGSTGSRAG